MKGLSTPLGITYTEGIVYITESGRGKIRVIDTIGKTIFDPARLTVANLKSILQKLSIKFPGNANKDTLKDMLQETLSARGGSDYSQSQRYLLDTNLKKPAAIHLFCNELYVSDLDLEQIIIMGVEIDGIFARSCLLKTIDRSCGDILSISLSAEKEYLAARGELGGIYQVSRECSSAGSFIAIITNGSSLCGEVHSVEVMERGIVYSDMKNGTVNMYMLP